VDDEQVVFRGIERGPRHPPSDRRDLGERVPKHGEHASAPNPRREIDQPTQEIAGPRGRQAHEIAQRFERPRGLPAKYVNRFADDGSAFEKPDQLVGDIGALGNGRDDHTASGLERPANARLAP